MAVEASENITFLGMVLVNLPSISIIGILAFFAKKWLSSLEKEAHNASENVNKIAHDYSLKLYDLSEKVHENLDVMLTRFSAWEDRVKDVISGTDKLNPDSKKSFLEFSNETRNELNSVKENIKKVNQEVGKVFQTFDELKISSKVADHSKCDMKESFKDLDIKIKNLQNHFSEKCTRNEEMLKKLFTLQRKLNDDIKNCEKAINTLAKTKGVIRLFDHFDNKKG